MINPEVREYRKSDKTVAIQLIEGMKDAMIAFDTLDEYDKKEGYGAEYLKEIVKGVSKKNKIFYVAEVKDKVVGYVIAELPEAPSKADLLGLKEPLKKFGTITEIYVESHHRGSNIGSKLIEKVEKWLKENGCNIATVGFFTSNKKALDFYNKLGYEVGGTYSYKKI